MNEQKFTIPKKYKSNDKVIDYLVNQRGLNKKLVLFLIEKGHIYEEGYYKDKKTDKKYITHNAVFVGYDFKDNPKSAFKRGTTAKRFVGIHDNSDKHFCTRLENKNPNLNVFESPIDMLSFITMGNKGENYLGMFGVSYVALDEYLKERKGQINKIIFRVDNDDAGISFAKNACEKYEKDYIVNIELPKYKDYNEDLNLLKEAR
jgi:hypothetical protein